MKLTLLSLGLASALAASPALAAAPACATPDFAAQAKALVDGEVKAGRFSGAVLVAKDGVAVLREGVGLANREWDIPNAPDTKFRLGSITKQFTAVAIMQLVEAGKLSVDDPISKYYADAPPAWSKITLKHLLTHTSGIPSYTGIPGFFDKDGRLPLKPEDIVKLTRDKPLEFEPGSKFAYDNSGYILLGYVIEKVSGQTYADYVTQHLLQPLGLKNTGYDVTTQILAKRASGYQSTRGGLRNAEYLDMSLPYAAGSLYSTVDDLLAWDRALTSGKLLTEASRKALWTDYGNKYGYGWVIGEQSGHPRINHGGGINGFATALNRYPADGLVTVVLSNFESAGASPLAANLAGLCLGTWQPPKAITLPTAILDKYVGSYALTPTFILKVYREGDQLITQATGQGPIPIVATAPGEFYAAGPNARLSFKQTGDAPATGLVLHQGGRDMNAERVPDKP
ncbi:serine hydrolase [uncultured Caulobacter sp.]|uniref:serine hydrolase n=1 Tax=uncultured Caulobacter sp. TaxID=158749 RepID=UPI0026054C88|nr:serine hydrolase [uncultured Caulobacter sp.]